VFNLLREKAEKIREIRKNIAEFVEREVNSWRAVLFVGTVVKESVISSLFYVTFLKPRNRSY
jgi:ribosomal protein S3AE